MDLYGFTRRHARAIEGVVAALLLAGLVMAFFLPVGLFPNVSFPRIVVSASSGELPPEQTLVQVTRPLEEAVSGVPGVQRVRSATSRGAAEISATFGWGGDMIVTTSQVEARVNQALTALPPGTSVQVRRMDPTVFPVVGYSLTSRTRTQVELRELALYTLRPLLMRVPNVARVDVLGGDQREYVVELDPAKLQARALAPQAVADAIGRGNVLASGGLLESPYRLYLALTDGRAASPQAIAALPVATAAGGQPVTIGDVGRVSESVTPRFTRITANGREAVLINIYQQPGGNTVAIDEGLKRAIAEGRHLMPPDVIESQFYNQAELITEAMGSVRDSILVGIALGIGVIWLFLRKFRLTLLAALSIPVSLGITILVLKLLNLSFNVMTLGGLAAAVGLVLDDAIVMIENVSRHMARLPEPGTAARLAVNELRVPFIGSSLCSIVVFAPLAFLTGVTGAFFRSLSLTMAAALAISLALTLALLPPLVATFVRPEHVHAEPAGSGRVRRRYRDALSWLFRRPWPVGLLAVALVAGTVALYQTLPNGFLPSMDEGAFILDYTTDPGTSLGQTNRTLDQIQAVLAKTPEVASYSRRTGVQLGGGLTEPNMGDFLIKLKPGPRRGIEDVIADVRGQVEGAIPGVRVEFAQLMEDLVGDLTAVPQPIEIKVLGEDFATDRQVAQQIAEVIPSVPGVVDVFNGITVAGPTLRAVVDPQAVARYGLSTQDVNGALAMAVGGLDAGQVLANGRMVGLRVRLGHQGEWRPETLGNVPVALPSGAPIPLSRLATLVEQPGETELTRENLQQMVAVTARIEGQSMGGTVDAIRRLVAKKVALPAGVTLSYGGLYEEQQASFNGLLMVILAAFVLLTVVLLFEFGQWGVPLSILAVDVLSLFGVLAALAVTGTPLNVSSMMGAVMIVGIVAENAVFFIHYVEQYRKEGFEFEDALAEAGRVRARPVLMTTLAAVLALLPLALGWGAGAQMQRPLAIAVIGGFSLSSVLILLVLPVLLRLLVHPKPLSAPSAAPPGTHAPW